MDEVLTASNPLIDQASAEYLGRWHRLVSTTNWEKGQIICQWRERLVEAGAPSASSTDEAWSRSVSGVSPQHVGRLRRVWQRFGGEAERYAGLYWSHFLAAIEWPDAEMWLEGAAQGAWSVSQMRQQRWEALGGPGEPQPPEAELSAAEYDEDVIDEPAPEEQVRGDATHEVRDPAGEALDAVDYEEAPADQLADEPFADEPLADRPEPVRPFENLGPLPADLAEPLERMKLAIVQHRMAQWRDVSCQEVLAALDALKQLATAT